MGAALREFSRVYEAWQAVVLRAPRRRRTSPRLAPPRKWTLCDAAQLFRGGSRELRETWCVENCGEGGDMTAAAFLGGRCRRGYCSFIAKTRGDVAALLARAPQGELPLRGHGRAVRYTDSFWVFCGFNEESAGAARGALRGRKLHTDDVPHDGTWHLQASGRKTWFIRPTQELLERAARAGLALDGSKEYALLCDEGDVICVNTRLWWHRTELPMQSTPSISYARDFWLGRAPPSSDLVNVDGFYAAAPIGEGTVVVREADMPDVELPRSADPNCAVVDLGGGEMALVASRDIRQGEWFSVEHSDDDDDGDQDRPRKRAPKHGRRAVNSTQA